MEAKNCLPTCEDCGKKKAKVLMRIGTVRDDWVVASCDECGQYLCDDCFEGMTDENGHTTCADCYQQKAIRA